jgi:predicted transcriptional regulator of viral defense system
MASMPEGGRETQRALSFNDQPHVDWAFAALGAAQHAVFSLDQLCALGMSASAVRARATAGRLHRLHRGVYSLVPRKLLTRDGIWLAAVLACGPGAVLSHRSAAALHDLRAYSGRKIDVTVPTRSARKQPGITIHRSTRLAPADVAAVGGIPCTSVARTLFDLAEMTDRRGLERAFDQCDAMQLFDLRAFEDQLARNPTRPGAAVVRAVLDEHYIGSTLTWSELEERFLRLCLERGLPQPEVNCWVILPDGGPAIRGDFVWREQRVIVEVDGRKYHRTRQAFERDRRRDQRTIVAGWRTVRATWRQLERAPDEVVDTVVTLVNR